MALIGAPVTHPPLPQRATNPLLKPPTYPGELQIPGGGGLPSGGTPIPGTALPPIQGVPNNTLNLTPDTGFRHAPSPMESLRALLLREHGRGRESINPLGGGSLPTQQEAFPVQGRDPLTELISALGSGPSYPGELELAPHPESASSRLTSRERQLRSQRGTARAGY